MKLLIALLFSIAFSGCVWLHQRTRGSVARTISENVAQVSVGEPEVWVGARVALFKNDCVEEPVCKKILVGEGTITKVINASYSEVTLDSPAKFTENNFIELIPSESTFHGRPGVRQ